MSTGFPHTGKDTQVLHFFRRYTVQGMRKGFGKEEYR